MADTFEWDEKRKCYKTVVESGKVPTYFNLVNGKIVIIPTPDPLLTTVRNNRMTEVRKKEMYSAGDVKLYQTMLEELERAKGETTTSDPSDP